MEIVNVIKTIDYKVVKKETGLIDKGNLFVAANCFCSKFYV